MIPDSHVSNLEILQVLLGDEAQIVLATYSRLKDLEDATTPELSAIGISNTAIGRLQAVWQLSKRRAMENARPGRTVMTAVDACDVVEPIIRGEKREMLIVLPLDAKSRLITLPIIVAIGTLSSIDIHPREIFRPVVKLAANAAILCHNHPSGEPVPSPDDVMVTCRLRDAGNLLGIPLNDHIVIGNGTYLSMRERGLF